MKHFKGMQFQENDQLHYVAVAVTLPHHTQFHADGDIIHVKCVRFSRPAARASQSVSPAIKNHK